MPTYIDLAVLYFVCLDGGYAAHHHLPKDFLDRAWKRMFELLVEAESRFGQDQELSFCRRFFGWFWLGEERFERSAALSCRLARRLFRTSTSTRFRPTKLRTINRRPQCCIAR
jgi:hypothetical protein